MSSKAGQTMSGLYELRDVDLKALDESTLEWMAKTMAIATPEKPEGGDNPYRRRLRKLYREAIAVRIQQTLKTAFCLYIPGDRHYWVVNGRVWYTSLQVMNLYGYVHEWNEGKYGKLYQIPQEHEVKTIWIVMAEDQEEDIEPLYLLETMTSDRRYALDLVEEAKTYPCCQGKYLSVVEALPEHKAELGA